MFAQPNGERLYKEPLTQSLNASYQGSELKHIVDSGFLQIKETHPIISSLGIAAYAIGIQHKISYLNTTLTPIPGTRSSLLATKTQVYISLTWSL